MVLQERVLWELRVTCGVWACAYGCRDWLSLLWATRLEPACGNLVDTHCFLHLATVSPTSRPPRYRIWPHCTDRHSICTACTVRQYLSLTFHADARGFAFISLSVWPCMWRIDRSDASLLQDGGSSMRAGKKGGCVSLVFLLHTSCCSSPQPLLYPQSRPRGERTSHGSRGPGSSPPPSAGAALTYFVRKIPVKI